MLTRPNYGQKITFTKINSKWILKSRNLNHLILYAFTQQKYERTYW